MAHTAASPARRLLARLRTFRRRPGLPAPTAAQPPAPGDPNEPYLYRPPVAGGDGTGPVTLDELYLLSRSL